MSPDHKSFNCEFRTQFFSGVTGEYIDIYIYINGGGNSHILYFHPEDWGTFPI